MNARFQISEAEQNRLILDHRHLVPKIASKYRGWKGVEFEELVAEGTLGLVVAGREWQGRSAFSTYAYDRIRGHILDFIKKQREFVPFSGGESEVHLLLCEWRGDAVQEGWGTLPTTPTAIGASFKAIRSSVGKAALAILTRREQRMVRRLLIKDPRISLAQVAREERMSYRKAMIIVGNAIRKLREYIKFHPQFANDRFPIANSIEGRGGPVFLPPPVNNTTSTETTGDSDVVLSRPSARKTDSGVPGTATAGGRDGVGGVEAPLLDQ